jgi:hypothetical protein
MTSLVGQRVPSPETLGCLPLSSDVNHVVGTTATKITKPAGKMILVIVADKGGWRYAVTDRSGSGTNDMPAAEFPVASVTDGTGAMHLGPGGSQLLPGPSTTTVKGYAADSVLTYYWL